MMQNKRLLLVGCGKMGGAIYRSLPRDIFNISVIEPNDPQFIRDLASLPNGYKADIVIFAIKPQQMEQLLPLYRDIIADEGLYISIAAGKTLSWLEEILASDKVARVMPNLAAIIGEGVSVCYAKIDARAKLVDIFGNMGKVLHIDDEEEMDIVTAISGSGPAYLFLLAEKMQEAAIDLGLDGGIAKILTYQTLKGSIELLLASEFDAKNLREQVTSPNGTTEAALSVLMQDERIKDAVKAAYQRSKNL